MQNKKDIVAYVLQTLGPDIGSSRCTLILLQFEPIAHLLSNQFLHHPMLHNWIPWVQHLKERFSIGSPLNFRYQTMTLSLTMKVISWQQQKQTFTSKTKPPQAKCPAQKQKWQVWCAYHTILLPSSLSPPTPRCTQPTISNSLGWHNNQQLGTYHHPGWIHHRVQFMSCSATLCLHSTDSSVFERNRHHVIEGCYRGSLRIPT